MTKPSAARSLLISGLSVPLPVRVSLRARRMTLKVNSTRDAVELVLPPKAREADIQRFVAGHADWIANQLKKLPQPKAFADGTIVPVLGIDRRIRHDSTHRGRTRITEHEIIVGGAPEFLPRRVRDALKAEAQLQLSMLVHDKAACISKRVASVTLRDTHTRWGSCSSTGRLSFNWRLIMAPDWVVDYVAAHEVAHLAEMNHSPRFWAGVEMLTVKTAEARAWLKANGAQLLQYG